MLLNKQINELHQIVVNNRLEPDDFVISHTQSIFSIELKNSSYVFLLSKLKGGFGLDLTPNIFARDEGNGSHRGWREDPIPWAYDWTSILAHFSKWAKSLSENATTPSLWSQSYQSNDFQSGHFDMETDMFSTLEILTLKNKLNYLKADLAFSSTLPKAAVDKISVIIEEAFKRIDNSTKSGFGIWFTQTVIAALIGLALNPTQVQDVLNRLKAIFQGLLLNP